MKTTPMLAATALLTLLAAPAFAQSAPMDTTPNPAVNATPTNSTPPAPPATMAPMAPSASGPDAAMPASATVPADVTVQTVTNGPVPDTPAMRAKYKPLSHAGRATKPAGN